MSESESKTQTHRQRAEELLNAAHPLEHNPELFDFVRYIAARLDREDARRQKDEEAYRGALGGALPYDHDGKLSDGTYPPNLIATHLADEATTLRQQLAACGVAAMQNTRASTAERLPPGHKLHTASYGDVCQAVDREIKLREDLKTAHLALHDAVHNTDFSYHHREALVEAGDALASYLSSIPIGALFNWGIARAPLEELNAWGAAVGVFTTSRWNQEKLAAETGRYGPLSPASSTNQERENAKDPIPKCNPSDRFDGPANPSSEHLGGRTITWRGNR